jgi:hypothetical protein
MSYDEREQLELFVLEEASCGQLSREQLLGKLAALTDAYNSGFLGGTQHELYPETDPGSRERALYFTLAPSLNYQRKSEGLWRSAFATYSDAETQFVFDPKEVDRGISAYRQALTRYGLAIQPEKQTSIWFTIATSLAAEFSADPRNLFAGCGYSVPRIKELVESRKRSFPYLSGPKLLNYWLYMITCFTTIPLVGREAISIVPDLHITRATVKLGLATSDELRSPRDVEAVWKRVLKGTGFAACDLHAPLWRWSRAGFPEVPSR